MWNFNPPESRREMAFFWTKNKKICANYHRLWEILFDCKIGDFQLGPMIEKLLGVGGIQLQHLGSPHYGTSQFWNCNANVSFMQEMGVLFFVLVILDLVLKGVKYAWIVVIVWLSLKIKSILCTLLCIVDTYSGN